MSENPPANPRRCPGVTRRSFLADTGMGFTGLAGTGGCSVAPPATPLQFR
jgi:hypothetical protein